MILIFSIDNFLDKILLEFREIFFEILKIEKIEKIEKKNSKNCEKIFWKQLLFRKKNAKFRYFFVL